jgi:HEAT repeat protein
VHSLASLVQADPAALVCQLVDVIRQRHPAQALLFRQVLEACAFIPPGKQIVVDDLLPMCDVAGLGFDPVTGRTHLEMLLGQCVRHGLLRYDPYAARYTLGDSAIQEALQGLIYPDVSACQQMARQRRLAAALLHQVQQGERAGLAALAQHVEAAYGAAARELLAPLVVVPFRRLLPTCTKEERQRMAIALGGFATALAVDLIRCLLHDEDGQVRSSAVQSLADLACEEAMPVLLEALQDSNSDVRWIATRALGRMPGTTAVDALIPMLTDEDKEVGRVAAEGLGFQGDRRAVPHLIAAIRESYPLLRESAILALGQLADQRAIPALQDVLQDANQQVRRSAEVALARFAASAGG